jgi:hypothetical protein
MKSTYSWDYNKKILTVYSCTGVHDFLREHLISSIDFNYPVVIADSVICCDEMFSGCDSYNQATVIPNSVTSCRGMFNDCITLNQNIVIPDSVIGRVGMFENCKKMQHHLAEGKTTNFFN